MDKVSAVARWEGVGRSSSDSLHATLSGRSKIRMRDWNQGSEFSHNCGGKYGYKGRQSTGDVNRHRGSFFWSQGCAYGAKHECGQDLKNIFKGGEESRHEEWHGQKLQSLCLLKIKVTVSQTCGACARELGPPGKWVVWRLCTRERDGIVRWVWPGQVYDFREEGFCAGPEGDTCR